jgi:hypothetical protein
MNAKARRWAVFGAIAASLLFVVSAALAGVTANSSGAPNAGARAAPSTVQAAAIAAATHSDVTYALGQAAASPNPIVHEGAARSAGLATDNITTLLTKAGVPDASFFAKLALASSSSDLSPAVFGPLDSYLEAAGVGCVLPLGGAGLGAYWGASGAGAADVGISAAPLGASEVVVTKVNPAVFALTCAGGAAAGLIIYQNGLTAGQAICYSCLYDEFAADQYYAYSEFLNLTGAMYASLISLLDFAQVAFDRMADNAALLQIGNATFNAPLDLLQSSLGYELSNLVNDYYLQVGSDVSNVLQWLSALGGWGSYYAGYAGLCYADCAAGYYGGAGITGGIQNLVENDSLGPATSTIAGPFFSAALSTTPSVTHQVLVTSAFVPWEVVCNGAPCRVTVTNYATGATKLVANVSAATSNDPDALIPVVNTTVVGVDNVSVKALAGGGTTWQLIIPRGFLMPTLSNVTLGDFAFVDRYTLLAPYHMSACGGSATTTNGAVTLGASVTSAPDVSFPTTELALANDKGDCGTTNDAVFVTPYALLSGFSGVPQVASGNVGTTSIDPWTQVGPTVAHLMLNATLNAQTYWAFIRSLGYSSLSQIPSNCVIPAPYGALPSQVDFGNLTLNLTEALYTAWLIDVGNFYGANASFSVCHGNVQSPWNWTNGTFVDPYLTTYGGVYLNNGSAPVGVTGRSLPSEVFATPSTWALPITAGSSGTPASVVSESNGTVGASSSGPIATTATAVVKAETLVVGVEINTAPSGTTVTATGVTDTAGNVFKELSSNTYASAGQESLWAVNQTTVASGSDVVSVALSGSTGTSGAAIASLVVLNGNGVAVPVPRAPLASVGRATLTASAPTNSLGLTFGLGDAANFTAPSGASTLAVTANGVTRVDVWKETGGTLAVGGPSGGIWGAFAVTVFGVGASLASNVSLFLAPTLQSVYVPVGVPWEIPIVDPIWAFYQPSTSTNSTLLLVSLTGNGTKLSGPQVPFGKAGDAIEIVYCAVNGTAVPTGDDCPILVTTFTTYIVTILCGSACNVQPPCSPCGGPVGATPCGDNVWLLGTIVDGVDGLFAGAAGIPIIGGALSALGCGIAWVVGVVLVLLVIAGLAWVILTTVRFGLSSRPKRQRTTPKKGGSS